MPFFVRSQGQVRGPFDVDGLQKLKARGRLHAFDQVSSDRATWVAASSLKELEPWSTASPIGKASTPSMPPMASVGQWHYADRTGKQTGPVSLETLSQFLQSGEVTQQSLVWHEGAPGWQTIAMACPQLLDGVAGPTGGTAPRHGLEAPRLGVSLVLISNVVFIGALVLGALAIIISSLAGQGRSTPITFFVAWSYLGVLALSQLLRILDAIGYNFFMRLQAQTGARSGAVATFVLVLVSLLLDFVAWVWSVTLVLSIPETTLQDRFRMEGQAVGLLVLTCLCWLVFVAHRMTFLSSLRTLADYLRAQRLAFECFLLILTGAALFLVFLPAYATAMAAMDAAAVERYRVSLAVCGIVLSLLVFAWYCFYVVTLVSVRQCLGQAK